MRMFSWDLRYWEHWRQGHCWNNWGYWGHWGHCWNAENADMVADAAMLAHPKIKIVTWQMFVELTSQSKLKFILRADSHLCLEKQRGCPLRGSHIIPESPLDETTHLCSSLLDIHGKDQVWVQRQPRGPPLTQRHDCWRHPVRHCCPCCAPAHGENCFPSKWWSKI